MTERFHGEEKRLQLIANDPEAIVFVDTDAIVTALLNLVDNARKYSDSDKPILIRSSAKGGEFRVTVEDQGVGLTPAAMRRVFDRFYQVDLSLSRQRGGCGLGLSIVKSIVAAHGGKIDVQSQQGRGSLFTIRLPRVEPRTATGEVGVDGTS